MFVLVVKYLTSISRKRVPKLLMNDRGCSGNLETMDFGWVVALADRKGEDSKSGEGNTS